MVKDFEQPLAAEARAALRRAGWRYATGCSGSTPLTESIETETWTKGRRACYLQVNTYTGSVVAEHVVFTRSPGSRWEAWEVPSDRENSRSEGVVFYCIPTADDFPGHVWYYTIYAQLRDRVVMQVVDASVVRAVINPTDLILSVARKLEDRLVPRRP